MQEKPASESPDTAVNVEDRYLVLIEEPLDDMRTEEKKNSFHARELMCELQREVRYSHYLPAES